MDQIFTEVIPDSADGERIDKVLATLFPDLSRARIQELMSQGKVKDENGTLFQPKNKAKSGVSISIEIPPLEDAAPIAQDIPLDILYEDDDLIVINKPCGLTVHPGAGQHDNTLVNALLFHCRESLSGIGGVMRPGIVHRLDKDTSGVMVVAKNDITHQHLSAQFADHGRTGVLERWYEAFVWGCPRKLEGVVETQIGRHPQHRLKMAVLPSGRGREAITHYQVMQSYWGESEHKERMISQIACRLETGRTHQIRVHMEHLKAPVVGDPLYGQGFQSRVKKLNAELSEPIAALKQQLLHARSLRFEHPKSGEVMQFTSDLPEPMKGIAERLGFLLLRD